MYCADEVHIVGHVAFAALVGVVGAIFVVVGMHVCTHGGSNPCVHVCMCVNASFIFDRCCFWPRPCRCLF